MEQSQKYRVKGRNVGATVVVALHWDRRIVTERWLHLQTGSKMGEKRGEK
jgi:hypothetical protein